MYHCAPHDQHASIARFGLDSSRTRGGPRHLPVGNTPDRAHAYALFFDEIWQIDVDGLPLERGGGAFSSPCADSDEDALRTPTSKHAGRVVARV